MGSATHTMIRMWSVHYYSDKLGLFPFDVHLNPLSCLKLYNQDPLITQRRNHIGLASVTPVLFCGVKHKPSQSNRGVSQNGAIIKHKDDDLGSAAAQCSTSSPLRTTLVIPILQNVTLDPQATSSPTPIGDPHTTG